MVTLTGTFTFLDGSPASGTVRVTPSRSPIVDVDGKIVISGSQVFPLDKDGKLAAQIPASDDPDLGPPFTYTIDVNLTHASWKISKVWIPYGSTTVDLSEVGDYQPTPGVATRVVTIPADGADGQVLVWDGVGFVWDFPPEGPPGEVTTAALTTALAGKVTGEGMTLRHDTTVGERVFLDHPGGSTMIHGDTGWRNVSDLLINGWTGTPLLRRTGNLVTLVVRNRPGRLDGSGATSSPFLTLPNGFQMASHNYSRVGYLGSGTLAENNLVTVYQEALNRIASGARVSDITGILSWQTSNAWPTTLPGTPS